MLLFSPGDGVTVSKNMSYANDAGIYVFGGTPSTQVSDNTIFGSTFDGIALDTSTGSTLVDNKITGGNQGIAVYATTSSSIRTNSATGAAGNNLFAASDTSNNRFQNNYAGTAAHFACRDNSTGSQTLGTANTWMRNIGDPSFPLTLCTPEIPTL